MWNLKCYTKELIYKAGTESWTWEKISDCQGREGIGGGWIGSLGWADENWYI